MRRRRVLGLAEMMNFPGVVSGSESELAKLALPGATHVDGHAPSVLGKALNAYVAAGIRSDHEVSTIEEGRERLRAYGIAPPAGKAAGLERRLSRQPLTIACPRCGSTDTARISEFGSTPCKAQYRCRGCLEPFDYFKCH